MKDIAQLGPELKRARIKKRWTMKELERRTGVGTGQIGEYEKGNVVPTIKTFEKLAKALGIRTSVWSTSINEHQKIKYKKRSGITLPRRTGKKTNYESIVEACRKARELGISYGDYIVLKERGASV